ncbi:hypothetical protein [Antarctobacter heliothermus]|uniref:hypothetical protein n=1 Tax=Antarctobacter heliothermus TaxID=74033 RepID=UPI0011306A24|nr:hypothetical protein [Antarctobacter heliothermus]
MMAMEWVMGSPEGDGAQVNGGADFGGTARAAAGHGRQMDHRRRRKAGYAIMNRLLWVFDIAGQFLSINEEYRWALA